MIMELMVMIPAPPIPLTARPRITTHIWIPRPLYEVRIVSQLLDQISAYLVIHPTANNEYESSNIGLRP
jgi:hypothetical protein